MTTPDRSAPSWLKWLKWLREDETAYWIGTSDKNCWGSIKGHHSIMQMLLKRLAKERMKNDSRENYAVDFIKPLTAESVASDFFTHDKEAERREDMECKHCWLTKAINQVANKRVEKASQIAENILPLDSERLNTKPTPDSTTVKIGKRIAIKILQLKEPIDG